MKSRRREFLAAVAVSTAACGGHPSPWRFLTQQEADILAAVCARIIPTDQDPGAVEAGVVDFIDRQLAGFYKAHQKTYRESVAGIGAAFVKLSAAEQTAFLKALEKKRDPFFDQPYEPTVAPDAQPAWEAVAKAAPVRSGVSANIKPKKKVAALFKTQSTV